MEVHHIERTSSRISSGRRTNPRKFPPIKPNEESGGSGPSGPPSSSASNYSNSLRKEKTVSSISLEEQVQTSRTADENLKVSRNNSETLNSQVEDENKADKLKTFEIVEKQYEEVLKNKTELESKFKINLVKTEAEIAELKYKTDDLELVKIKQKYNSLLEKIRVTEEKIQKIKLEINKKNREYARELFFSH